MLYLLWDLGLKVGHATRSRADCLVDAKADATVLTALPLLIPLVILLMRQLRRNEVAI